MYFYTIKKKKSMAMQRNYFTVLFFLKKSKLLKKWRSTNLYAYHNKRKNVQRYKSSEV